MRLPILFAILLTGCSTTQADPQPLDNPFEILREAYAERDAAKAASAYTDDATLRYQYTQSTEFHEGSDQIEASFQELFSRVDSDVPIDLNFRIESSEQNSAGLRQTGIYRLRFGDRDASFGTFDVLVSPDDGRFIADISTDSSRDDFERLAGPVMFDSESEDLDQQFYGKLTGRFAIDAECDIVITQSFVRLFARNTCSGRWQGLTRLSGLEWTGGDRVISDQETTRFEFVPDPSAEFLVSAINITEDGRTVSAQRRDRSTVTRVSFPAQGGATLHGNLYTPAGASSGLATVFVHGSGPQDRNGYASIIAVSAEELAARGNTVLTFDKRGVGESSGDWSRMSFEELGLDAVAAMQWLRNQRSIGPHVGLAGSSQAGWVIAKAVEVGANPHHVHLLGAAGTALSVEEQNIYNTRVRMQCEGIEASKIELALEQQQAFFDYVRTRDNAETLDRLTDASIADPAIRDWLFPRSSEIDFPEGNWFTTLEVDFDPLPIWTAYTGRTMMVFSQFDDSTPTRIAVDRLNEINTARNDDLRVIELSGAQHIGLEATSPCAGSLSEVTRFHPDLFDTFDALIAE